MTVREHTSLDGVTSIAEYSMDEKYRYFLTRYWNRSKKPLAFLMLNPSTATETQNDPTVERCERRARKEEYGGIHIYNLFAYRATDPKDMKAQDDPIGKWNNHFLHLLFVDVESGLIDLICGWGNHGTHLDRGEYIIEMMHNHGLRPLALQWTKAGQPKHPLYIPYSAKPQERP